MEKNQERALIKKSYENNIVEKSNVLNTMMCGDMSFTELRFFCMYLSKLNARNPNERTIEIPIKDFEALFDVEFNTTAFNRKIMQVATRGVKVKTQDDSDDNILTLYSCFKWKKNSPRVLTITCNDMILPHIFGLPNKYTSYTLGSIAKLNSMQKLRLYEICKQYQYQEKVTIPIDELQEMLGSKVTTDFGHFKRDVLEPAVKDLNNLTDIIVSYKKEYWGRRVGAVTITIKDKKAVAREVQIILVYFYMHRYIS